MKCNNISNIMECNNITHRLSLNQETYQFPFLELELDPTEVSVFEEARRLGVHRTVHAGEAGPPGAVRQVSDSKDFLYKVKLNLVTTFN